MFVHIGNSKRDGKKLPAAAFVNVAHSASTSAFFHQVHSWIYVLSAVDLSITFKPWSILGSQLVDAANAITIAEKEAFELLRGEVVDFSPRNDVFC